MTSRFTADIRKWTEKQKRNASFIVRGAAQDVIGEMSRPAPGVSRGGSVSKGHVPVDTSELINSLSAGIGMGIGSADWAGVVSGMKVGDVVTAAFTAKHAPMLNYGVNGRPGWFFVDHAIAQWPAIVAANAAKFR